MNNKEWDYVKVIKAALPEDMRVIAWSPVCDGTLRMPRVHERVSDSIWIYGEKVEKSEFNESHIGDRGDNDHRTNIVEVRRPEAATTAAATSRSRHDFQKFCRFDDDHSSFGRLLCTVKIQLAANDPPMSCDDTKYVAEPERLYSMYFIAAKQSPFCSIKYYMASMLFNVRKNLKYPSIVRAKFLNVPKEVPAF